jgi:hypothetical protein
MKMKFFLTEPQEAIGQALGEYGHGEQFARVLYNFEQHYKFFG